MNFLNEDLLVSLMDEFLEPFGLDSDFDSDFYYDPEEERVYFTVLMTEKSDRLFKQYILNEFSFCPPSIFMMSILHEIGHAFTYYDLPIEVIIEDNKEKKQIEELYNLYEQDETYLRYFDLKMERVATEWAVKYYKEHEKEVGDFFLKFVNALNKEYKRLELTE